MTREPTPRDLDDTATKLATPRAAFNSGLRAVVADTGPAAGAATYRLDGPLPRLGHVDAPGLRAMYELVLSVAHRMIAAGHTRGDFTISDAALLRQLKTDFTINAQPVAFAPLTARDIALGAARIPVAWRVEVDLADAVTQLEQALA